VIVALYHSYSPFCCLFTVSFFALQVLFLSFNQVLTYGFMSILIPLYLTASTTQYISSHGFFVIPRMYSAYSVLAVVSFATIKPVLWIQLGWHAMMSLQ